VRPAEHLIRPGDRVFIVSDDRLNGLNFETLLTPGESSHYWIEDVTVTQIPSVRLMTVANGFRTAHRPPADKSQLLVIGNPIYSGQQYSPLPHAADEISGVATHFPHEARTVLTGASASPVASTISTSSPTLSPASWYRLILLSFSPHRGPPQTPQSSTRATF
jgi:CHAT domain-containing protein